MKTYFTRLFTIWLCLGFAYTSVAQSRTLAGKVVDIADNSPMPGVSLLIKGTTNGTITAADGTFSLSVQPADVLVVSFIGFKTQEIPVHHHEHLSIQLQSTDIALSELIVVGSRSATARTNIETPAPVDVISSKEITATGRTDLTQILNFVAPSLNSNRQPGGDGTAHIDPVALRGIAPDQTLVLVNGKRRHSSALVNVLGTPSQGATAVDFNAIPAAAIERIEVLRDGAAAQYGSDAIAGVINIVLKKDVDKVRVSATTGGFATKFRNKRDGFTLQTDVNYGFKIGTNGYINVTGQLNNRQGTDRSGFYEYKNRLTGAPLYWFPYAVGTPETEVMAKESSVNRYSSSKNGNGLQDNAGLFVNAMIPLGNKVELYAFGGVASKLSVSANNAYRFPNGTSTINNISSRYIPSIFPNGYLPENVARINDKSMTVGVRGQKNGWDMDFSNTFGANNIRYTVQNSLNVSMGTASPMKVNSGELYFQQNTTNLGLTRRFEDVGFLPSVNVAFGGEYRIENYKIIAGQAESYKNYGDTYLTTVGGTTKSIRPAGIQAFPGYQPTDEQDQFRNSIGMYGDVEMELSKRLLLTGALRYENYSDFGDQLTWKVSGIGKLLDNPNGNVENISIRGAVSTGFRAPSLPQKYYSATTSLPQGDGSLILSLVSNNESAVTKSFGVPSLRAETSKNLSAGITSRLFRNFTATIDAYQIAIKNRVTLTGMFDYNSINSTDPVVKGAATLVKSLLVNYPDVNAAQFFANAIDTRTKGVDIVLAYRNRVGSGTLNVSLSGNFTHTDVVGVHVPGGLTSSGSEAVRTYLSERIFFDRQQRIRYESGTPQNKFILMTSYTFGRFIPNLVLTRFGQYTIGATQSQLDSRTGNRDQTFTPKVITDLTLNYQLTKAVTLTAGANNLADVYPDQQRIENNQTGTTPYGTSAGQQFGSNGAFYYGRLIFSF